MTTFHRPDAECSEHCGSKVKWTRFEYLSNWYTGCQKWNRWRTWKSQEYLKDGVSKVSQAPKNQAKRKLTSHKSESDKTYSPSPVKKVRNTKTKPIFSPRKLVVLPKEKTVKERLLKRIRKLKSSQIMIRKSQLTLRRDQLLPRLSQLRNLPRGI